MCSKPLLYPTINGNLRAHSWVVTGCNSLALMDLARVCVALILWSGILCRAEVIVCVIYVEEINTSRLIIHQRMLRIEHPAYISEIRKSV
jgi:hypothetical protein